MRVLCSLNASDLKHVGEFASKLESSGFTDASTQENKQDPFLPIAISAIETKKLSLGQVFHSPSRALQCQARCCHGTCRPHLMDGSR